jgi:hypothetical protein
MPCGDKVCAFLTQAFFIGKLTMIKVTERKGRLRMEFSGSHFTRLVEVASEARLSARDWLHAALLKYLAEDRYTEWKQRILGGSAR